MRKRIPTFIAGMLTTALIGSLGVGALAATGQLTLTVDPINIQVNGATFAPKDAKGNSVPVFALNGTTYAPLRALAEAYGLDVWYDPENTMAAVGAKGSAPVETPPTGQSDPNRKPDITVDELKAMFKFVETYDANGRDVFSYMYSGEEPIEAFIEEWKALEQDDVKAAITVWAEGFYKTEYEGNKEIRIALHGKRSGTTIDFAGIRYAPANGASDFYFDWSA